MSGRAEECIARRDHHGPARGGLHRDRNILRQLKCADIAFETEHGVMPTFFERRNAPQDGCPFELHHAA